LRKHAAAKRLPLFVVEILYVIRGTNRMAREREGPARASRADTKTTAPFLTFKNAQRENGEVLAEGQAQWNSRPPKAA
jgi:hypothetical protein